MGMNSTSPASTKRNINRAIRRLGVEIQNNRGGYSYFTSLATGNQVGESVMVCWLSQQSVAQWAADAARTVASSSKNNPSN